MPTGRKTHKTNFGFELSFVCDLWGNAHGLLYININIYYVLLKETSLSKKLESKNNRNNFEYKKVYTSKILLNGWCSSTAAVGCYLCQCKSNTKQRMIHGKGFPATKGQSLVFRLPEYG